MNVIVTDRRSICGRRHAVGNLIVWERSASPKRKALGRSLDIIIPQRLREWHWHSYDTTVRAGQSHYGEGEIPVCARTAEGTRISVEFTGHTFHRMSRRLPA
jgi:hypothetical protein